ncbi:outer membrane usher protein [Proteus sp. TJ1640]|uniref:outer membrane usher protein n=1 Tax=Proteus sp. TJ1640 TaxID=2050968 RepID=UPI000D697DB9|nr:outer membrane usher protein [Proteus sp. TJ1640]
MLLLKIKNVLVRKLIIVSAFFIFNPAYSNTFEFSSNMFNLEDGENIDVTQFSKSGYILPGTYTLKIQLNQNVIAEQPITFYADESRETGSSVCLSPEQVSLLALKPEILKQINWLNDESCLDWSSLPGATYTGDLGTLTLHISIPQAYIEYSDATWEPASRWDEGISGLIFDYSINAKTNRPHKSGNNTYSLNSNGVAGINLGVWRVRGDWQGRLNHGTGSQDAVNTDFKWSRFYAYRAISQLKAKLTLGEVYLESDLFDTFRFIGAILGSDLSMLPPNLRGYAPEVNGVAQTSAQVIISQQGRIIYQTQVAAGPFSIQDLSSAVSGTLDVRVEEQDGRVQEYQVNTATIPYLTRPGQVRYKVAFGRPADMDHRVNGDVFATGEFSWGVTNGWSLFAGSINSQNYNAFSAGFGRDLLALGALSFDVTQSIAKLYNGGDKDKYQGRSYRISYSKRFDDIDSQIQFAGYRFSERDFMSMSQFLDAQQNNSIRENHQKELYTITLSKNFRDYRLSTGLNYRYQTYWNQPDQNRYDFTAIKYFDIGNYKNLSLSLNLFRNKSNWGNDQGAYVSMTMPWGTGGNLSYSSNIDNDNNISNTVGFFNRVDENTSYRISAGNQRKGALANAYIYHEMNNATLSGTADYVHNQYTAFGLNVQGGMTMTMNGGAIHRSSLPGGTRLLVDTDGVENIPVQGYSTPVYTNAFGKAVLPEVNSYYKNKIKIDINNLPEDAEVNDNVLLATLTEGAIGYRKFEVNSGMKLMAVIRLSDGSYPPFAAQITNSKDRNTGIVGEFGNAYITGINPNESMTVSWGGNKKCQINFPDKIENNGQSLILVCSNVME